MLHFLQLVLLSNFLMAADLASAASLSDLSNADQKYWHKILHFNKKESRADGEKFFLAKNGKFDANAEFIATIETLKDPNAKAGWFNYPAQCVFRERYAFLKKLNLLEGAPEASCPEFDEWKKGLNAESISLIFSSSYPNNPSSLFGHTLLRLNQKDKTNDLLDYAVAFSAIPDADDSGLVFAFKGIFGGYRGLFEVTKYYTKVNEYNNGESRDLIEYNLKMTPEELDRLTNHLWELYQTTYFDYFFTDENCSAVLADLLAVAYKDDDNVNAHARWFYLPGEMIKHFYTLDDRIASTKYRPSLKKQISKQWEHLSPLEISEVEKIIDEKVVPEGYQNSKVLDAVVNFLDFTHYRTKEKLEPELAALKRDALIKRARLPKTVRVEESFDQINRPENAHDPQKIVVFNKFQNGNYQLALELKQGYHDLMANDVGFDRFSHFEFLNAAVIYDFKNKKFNYDYLTIVELVSLHEYRYFDPQASWKVKVGLDRIYDLDCGFCHKYSSNAYGGVTVKPNDLNVFSLMAGVFLEMSSHHKKGYRAGPAAEVAYYTQIGEFYKFGLSDEIRYDATKNIKTDFYNKASVKNSFFLSSQSDLRLNASFISKFGSFKKNSTVYEVAYGFYF